MARLLVDGTWFESIRSQSWGETDYEAVVLDQAQDLFPAWRCIPFKATIEGEDGTRKQPDMALIDLMYRHWWVVEIELAHHNLYSHVIPQVDAFRTGAYGPEHAAVLHSKAPDLDLSRLEAMVTGEPPDVLVIVDSPYTNWRAPLLELRTSLAIVEPFRDLGTKIALRLNGDQPQPHATHLSRCSRSQLRRLWRVHSPAALPPGAEVLSIEFDGVETRWSIVPVQDGVMIKPERGDVLVGAATVDLVLRDDGGLAFKQVSNTTRSRRRPL